ncbi:hypothetical protein ACPYO6_08735 [Georgenia sp. Z1344]|uniref:hypothetical protein n=1 Tax=Georgenia sp. Z1344 TaxID=3416706 RepID=UPI003CF7998D
MTASVALAAAAALTLAACGSDGEDATPAEEPTSEEAPEEEETTEETESESEETPSEDEESESEETPSDDAAGGESPSESASDEGGASAGAGSAAPWANEVTEDGELLGTIEAGDVTVDVYQVGTGQATRSSIWADPDTDEPIVNEGDEVLILNYVVTNNGDPITLTYGLVDAGLSYDTWPYMQQPSVSDTDLLEENGVNDNAVNGDSLGEDTYVLGTGEQYSVGEVMLYQPGEAFTVEVSYEPRDDAGERLGEEFEGELTGTVE